MRYLSKTNPKALRGVALIRLDFNTEDEWRMEASLTTLKFLLKVAEKVIVVSHRGRPKGVEKKFSLQKDARRLRGYLHRPVHFISRLNFKVIQKTIDEAPKGSLFVFENLRFDPGEGKNDRRFAKSLASLADFYVNDAFAVSHRDAASVVAITKFLPSYAGFELEAEIRELSQVMKHPKRPVIMVLGGGKAHDKLGVIKYFLGTAQAFLLGGASANTISAVRGIDVKKSKVDDDIHDKPLLKKIANHPTVIVPIDVRMKNDAILDIGPHTEKLFARYIKSARTIVWSGPLGFIEDKKFSHGNLSVARAIAANRKAFTVAGGGETVMFLKKYHLDKKFSFISTGGGAMLGFLAGEKLPGIEALKK